MVISNFIIDLIVVVMLLLVFFRTENSLGRQKQIIYYKMIVAGLALSALLSAAKYLLNSIGALEGNDTLLKSMAIAVTLPGAFALMSWTGLIATTVRIKWEEKLWWRILTIVPFAIIVAVYVTPLADSLFIVGENGNVTLGIGYWMLIGVDLIYFALAAIVIFKGRKILHHKVERRFIIATICFCATMIIGVILDAIFQETPILEAASIPAVFFIYAELQSSQASTDALTDLYNRRKIDAFLQSAMDQASEEHSVELFFIDIDYFKSVNDILGHQAGDVALQTFADALRSAATLKGTIVGRWGGDEFVVLAINGKRDPKIYTDNLRLKLNELSEAKHLGYDLNFSYGWAICTTMGVTPAEIMKKADDALYRMKEEHHEKDGGAFQAMLEKTRGGK